MIMELFNNPISFFMWVIALISAIAIHEFAHAWAADRLGDPTPRLQGRLTLNPLAHLDPMGTILLLVAGFGWGKPVQFDPYNLRNPRRDGAVISLAGPVSNIILATIAALVFRLLGEFQIPFFAHSTGALILFVVMALLRQLVTMNIILAIFNLVPIHPLDGFKIVGGLLPREQASQWQELEGYGFIFLLLLLLPMGGVSPISHLISPVISFLLSVLLPSGRFI